MSDTVVKVSKITRPIYMAKKHREIIDYTSGSNLLPVEFIIKDWTIPSGATATFYAKKPSGRVLFNSCEVNHNTNSILLTPTLQLFAEAGVVPAQIQILSDGSILNSYLIEFQIEDKVVSDEAIESTDEFTAFAQILGSTQTLTESVVADYISQHGISTGANASQVAQIDENRTVSQQASADIQALQEVVSGLADTVNQLATTVSAISETVATVAENVQEMIDEVERLSGEMADLNEGIEYDLADL